MFSVNSKNLSVGCTARFREIKGEKLVFATFGEKTIAHACFRENPGSSARVLQLVSACCLRVQAFGAKSQLCKGFTDRKPFDNTFLSVFKPKHNLAPVKTLLEPTWNAGYFSESRQFVFVLAGFPQLACVILHACDAYACLLQRARIIKDRTVQKL